MFRNKFYIILSSVLIAIALHAAALYFLHGITISFTSYGKAYIENRLQEPLGDVSKSEPNDLHEELATIFNNMEHFQRDESEATNTNSFAIEIPYEVQTVENLISMHQVDFQPLESLLENPVEKNIIQLPTLLQGSSSHEPADAKIASSQDFDIEVEYSPINDEKGYLFCLKVIPKSSVNFKRIKQNFFFLIDRSHSINSERFQLTKDAVLDILPQLHPEDTFNILVFDNKVVRLSENNLACKSENYQKAAAFLAQQQHGGIFATTDLYSSLGDIIPPTVADNEVNTAILLSDGDTYLSQENQRKSISKWTQQNGGKVSLFSLAAGSGNNLPLLDLLSSFNKGVLQYAENYSDIKGRMKHLIKSIQNPIGKEIQASVILTHENNKVSVYPLSYRLPNLYRETVYKMYGCTEDLSDFLLVLQGKYYEKDLDIKQRISFADAKKVAKESIERYWALQKAYESYAGYLKDGNRIFVTQAKEILAPQHLKPAFQ